MEGHWALIEMVKHQRKICVHETFMFNEIQDVKGVYDEHIRLLLRHAGWDKRETNQIPLMFVPKGTKVKLTTNSKKHRINKKKWTVEQHKIHLINARNNLPDCGPMAFMLLYRELGRAYGRLQPK